MELPITLINIIEENGYTVNKSSDCYYFGKYSSYGQDFSFYVDFTETLESFAENIKTAYNEFDVSYKTYIWLDQSGHGTNGAPEDMKEAYDDNLECREYIMDLYNIVNNYIIGEIDRDKQMVHEIPGGKIEVDINDFNKEDGINAVETCFRTKDNEIMDLVRVNYNCETDSLEIMVFADPYDSDYTNKFEITMRQIKDAMSIPF